MFHKHKYKEIARTYTPPNESYIARIGMVLSGEERIIHGCTIILWECEICQKLRKEELLGKETYRE